jgi:hypothetical protein
MQAQSLLSTLTPVYALHYKQNSKEKGEHCVDIT